MIYRECGVYRSSYAEDMVLFPLPADRVGVGFAVSLIAFKALPVLIIGGVDSIPGAIAGGLIVGATESLAEGFVGPLVGGGVQEIFPYLVALVFLMVRPYGLFGRPEIERV